MTLDVQAGLQKFLEAYRPSNPGDASFNGWQEIDIHRVGDLTVAYFTPKGDKVERVNGQTALIEAGHVLLPVAAPWLKAFLDEVRAFPGGKHDDQVHSMTHFLMRARLFAKRIKQFERG